MKKLLILMTVLAVITTMGFAAGQDESITSDSGLKPMTISYSIYNTSPKFENDSVYQWITEEYNVDFDWYQASGSDWQEKIQIWVASGDMPDVINWDFKYHHMP